MFSVSNQDLIGNQLRLIKDGNNNLPINPATSSVQQQQAEFAQALQKLLAAKLATPTIPTPVPPANPEVRTAVSEQSLGQGEQLPHPTVASNPIIRKHPEQQQVIREILSSATPLATVGVSQNPLTTELRSSQRKLEQADIVSAQLQAHYARSLLPQPTALNPTSPRTHQPRPQDFIYYQQPGVISKEKLVQYRHDHLVDQQQIHRMFTPVEQPIKTDTAVARTLTSSVTPIRSTPHNPPQPQAPQTPQTHQTLVNSAPIDIDPKLDQLLQRLAATNQAARTAEESALQSNAAARQGLRPPAQSNAYQQFIPKAPVPDTSALQQSDLAAVIPTVNSAPPVQQAAPIVPTAPGNTASSPSSPQPAPPESPPQYLRDTLPRYNNLNLPPKASIETQVLPNKASTAWRKTHVATAQVPFAAQQIEHQFADTEAEIRETVRRAIERFASS